MKWVATCPPVQKLTPLSVKSHWNFYVWMLDVHSSIILRNVLDKSNSITPNMAMVAMLAGEDTLPLPGQIEEIMVISLNMKDQYGLVVVSSLLEVLV